MEGSDSRKLLEDKGSTANTLMEPHANDEQRQGKFSSTLKSEAQQGSRSLTVVLHSDAIMSRPGAQGRGRGSRAERAIAGEGNTKVTFFPSGN